MPDRARASYWGPVVKELQLKFLDPSTLPFFTKIFCNLIGQIKPLKLGWGDEDFEMAKKKSKSAATILQCQGE